MNLVEVGFERPLSANSGQWPAAEVHRSVFRPVEAVRARAGETETNVAGYVRYAPIIRYLPEPPGD